MLISLYSKMFSGSGDDQRPHPSLLQSRSGIALRFMAEDSAGGQRFAHPGGTRKSLHRSPRSPQQAGVPGCAEGRPCASSRHVRRVSCFDFGRLDDRRKCATGTCQGFSPDAPAASGSFCHARRLHPRPGVCRAVGLAHGCPGPRPGQQASSGVPTGAARSFGYLVTRRGNSSPFCNSRLPPEPAAAGPLDVSLESCCAASSCSSRASGT